MPRVTHVKSAQQRYETVPVIDPETGEQKQTPVMNRKTGEQKTTKTGKPIFLKVSTEDRTRPKPNLRCDYSGCEDPEIRPGQSYKHITPKSGAYGGTQKSRHEQHPSWNEWEYSSSLSARVAEIVNDFDPSELDCTEDVQTHLEQIAEQVRELASEKEESASNIEDGFGHETEMSASLNEQAEALNNWADEIESLDIPEFPEPEERYFLKDPEDGTIGAAGGYETDDEAQDALDELGKSLGDCWGPEDISIEVDTADEPSTEQISEWQDECCQMDLGDPGV